MLICGDCGTSNPDHARFCSACGAEVDEHPDRGSRREVTILFSDLVGSTSLSRQLDAETLRSILHRYFDAMRAAVERHGGRVEKFIGDAVMAVFGVPMLHEDDALRAVRAASEMRTSLQELNDELERQWRVRLDARIGIASGEVVTGGASAQATLITGPSVNLAARLEQAAHPGEVLLSDPTLRLVRRDVETEPLGAISLKGFGDQVVVHRLVSSASPTEPRARGRESNLVGRERELDLLIGALERTVAERRCELVTILGQPGIGKSRLVEGFLEVTGSGVKVLEGRCLSYGEGITFWPMFEIVQGASGFLDTDPVPTAARKIIECMPGLDEAELVAGRIGQLLGLFGGPPAPEETFWAIRLFVEAQAREQPLVLVLEDIHWAEPTFIAAIEHVVERSQDVPILVVCMARDDLIDTYPGWAEPRAHAVVRLEPLGADDASVLVEGLLGEGDVSAEIRDLIVGRSEGVPLYAEEIVSALQDEGYLLLKGGRWVLTPDLSSFELPTTISGLIAARLDRLQPDERVTIERASIVGRDFLATEVAALSPSTDLREVVERLDALATKDLLRRIDVGDDGEWTYRFRHLLILDTAYEAMRKTMRAELHERYANWLEGRVQRQSEKYEELIAYHLERAYALRSDVGPADAHLEELRERAAHRLSGAGRLASGRGDMPASANLLGRAIRLLAVGAPERNAILHDLALALWQAGDIDEVEAVYREELEAGHTSGDPVLEARSRLALAELRMETDPASISADELRREAERSIPIFEEAGADNDLADALLILGTTHWLNGAISDMLDVSERAFSVSRGTQTDRGAASYIGRALVLGTTRCDEALTRLEALVAQVAGARLQEATAALDLATIYAMVDRPDDAEERAARSLATFEELGQGRWVAEGHHTAGIVLWLSGDAEGAELELGAACEWYEHRGELLELGLSSIDLANVLLDLDRVDDAEAIVDVSASSAARYDVEAQIGWRAARARVLARAGRDDDARMLVAEAADLVTGTELLDLRGWTLLAAADVLARSGDGEEARVVAQRARDSFERKGNRVGVKRADAVLRS
ncbi:MAG TPA: adenylate/guanylate cyclase domain-containing protein [Actinomycetota bacterium]